MAQWITNIEDKIIRLRRTVGHLTAIISCKKTGIFTTHQKNLKDKYYKKYGNTNSSTRRKGTTEKLLIESFFLNPKAVYRDFKSNNISTEKLPTKESIETFWKGIWQKKPTLTTVRNGYSNWKVLTAAM